MLLITSHLFGIFLFNKETAEKSRHTSNDKSLLDMYSQGTVCKID